VSESQHEMFGHQLLRLPTSRTATERGRIKGWRAIAEVTADHRRLPKTITLIRDPVLRIFVHAEDSRLWVKRPCAHVPKEWRSVERARVQEAASTFLIVFGYQHVQPGRDGVSNRVRWSTATERAGAQRLVEALLVERDSFFDVGEKVRSKMRVFRWEEFVP
jgi:hypothetical protein